MNPTDYGHLTLALAWIYGAVRYTFIQRFNGHPPQWPPTEGGYRMSAFSRWLVFTVFMVQGLWQLARSLFHLPVSFISATAAMLCLVALVVSYFYDRRQSRIRQAIN